MSEGEIDVDPWLVEKGEALTGGAGEVGMGDAQLPQVNDPEGIRGGVMDVKVA